VVVVGGDARASGAAEQTGYANNGGNQDRRCYGLTFHRRHYRLVFDEYLPHVRRRGREILFSNRRRRLYTNNRNLEYVTCLMSQRTFRFYFS
jgi:hypothetical protein